MNTNRSFRVFPIFVLVALSVVAMISVQADRGALALTSRESISLEKYFASERSQIGATMMVPNELGLAIYHMSERDRGLTSADLLDADPLAAYRASEWQRTPRLALSQGNVLAAFHQSEWNRNALLINPGQEALQIYHLSERDRTK